MGGREGGPPRTCTNSIRQILCMHVYAFTHACMHLSSVCTLCCTVFVFLAVCMWTRTQWKGKERRRARERSLLLIGKYRNARNIEHLDGTTSVGGPSATFEAARTRTKRCTMQRRSLLLLLLPLLQEEGRVWVAGWVLVWVWRRFFRRQASTAPAVLVKRIRRLSRDWE